VEDEDIARAILVLMERERLVAEGAGAAGLGALLSGSLDVRGKKVAVVLSGGNIDVNLISRIIDRGLAHVGRLMRVRVTIPDVPGALGHLADLVGGAGANILETVHHRAFSHGTLGESDVELTLETRGRDHGVEVVAAVMAEGYTAVVED